MRELLTELRARDAELEAAARPDGWRAIAVTGSRALEILEALDEGALPVDRLRGLAFDDVRTGLEAWELRRACEAYLVALERAGLVVRDRGLVMLVRRVATPSTTVEGEHRGAVA